MLLGVTPADITLAPLNAARTLHPSRRSGFGTWALAARLSARDVRRAQRSFPAVAKAKGGDTWPRNRRMQDFASQCNWSSHTLDRSPRKAYPHAALREDREGFTCA